MILIDNSYLVYYQGFATYTWFKNEIGLDGIIDDGTFDPMSDPEFKAMFTRQFLKRIHSVVANEVVFFKKSDLVFCLDCHRKNIWRNDFFPEYKLLRGDKKREFSWSGIFDYVNNIMLPEYVEKGAKIIQNPNAEGDDCIATLTNYLYEKGHRDTIIIASDNDITQLSDIAKIITLKGEHKTYQTVIDKYKFKDKLDWTADMFLTHKAIMGDKGDEIPSIKSGIGPKRAFDCIKNNFKGLSKILEDKDAFNKFEMNKKIIDFQYIPKEISDDIISQYETCESDSLINL